MNNFDTIISQLTYIYDELTIIEHKIITSHEICDKNFEPLYQEIFNKIIKAHEYELDSCCINIDEYTIDEVNYIINNLRDILEPKLYFIDQTYIFPYYVFISW